MLRDEKQQIERSIQNTSVSNHGAFIETAECLGTINTELTSVCEKLELLLQVRLAFCAQQLPQHGPEMLSTCGSKAGNVVHAGGATNHIHVQRHTAMPQPTAIAHVRCTACLPRAACAQDIPGLASSCEAFSSRSSAVLEQYSQNKALAGSQSALLEVLEVPALMDTCVRNGIYDEALDLQAFVHRMGLLHPDIPAVRMLMQQVNTASRTHKRPAAAAWRCRPTQALQK